MKLKPPVGGSKTLVLMRELLNHSLKRFVQKLGFIQLRRAHNVFAVALSKTIFIGQNTAKTDNTVSFNSFNIKFLCKINITFATVLIFVKTALTVCSCDIAELPYDIGQKLIKGIFLPLNLEFCIILTAFC